MQANISEPRRATKERTVPITEFDHYTLRAKDADASWRFYEQVLGLDVVQREGFPVPAFIVSIGQRQVVHGFQASPENEAVLARIKSNDPEAVNWPTGRLLHVEFWATGLEDMKQRWSSQGVPFTERTLPDKHQVSLRDPDDIIVNLNFPLAEVGK